LKHLVIVNPVSFKKKSVLSSVLQDIRAYFDREKSDYYIYTSRYPRDAIDVVGEYIANTDEAVRVYAVGGDGILNDCLNGLAGFYNAELAIMPYGFSDDFINSFGKKAVADFRDISKQATAKTIHTDVIKLNDKYVLNILSVGTEAVVIDSFRKISRKYPILKKLFGIYTNYFILLRCIFDKKISEKYYEVTIDGECYKGNYNAIAIANGSCYGRTMTPFPMAHPADGYLDVVLSNPKISPSILFKVFRYTKGKHYKYPSEFRYVRAKEISIKSTDQLNINADGEVYFASEIKAEIFPLAIKIAAPGEAEYVRRREYGS